MNVDRRREHMVGVSMVLAELAKFKPGLYNSCGIECFEGIMLEPWLLQPCFHVDRHLPPCAGGQGRSQLLVVVPGEPSSLAVVETEKGDHII